MGGWGSRVHDQHSGKIEKLTSNDGKRSSEWTASRLPGRKGGNPNDHTLPNRNVWRVNGGAEAPRWGRSKRGSLKSQETVKQRKLVGGHD